MFLGSLFGNGQFDISVCGLHYQIHCTCNAKDSHIFFNKNNSVLVIHVLRIDF